MLNCLGTHCEQRYVIRVLRCRAVPTLNSVQKKVTSTRARRHVRDTWRVTVNVVESQPLSEISTNTCMTMAEEEWGLSDMQGPTDDEVKGANDYLAAWRENPHDPNLTNLIPIPQKFFEEVRARHRTCRIIGLLTGPLESSRNISRRDFHIALTPVIWYHRSSIPPREKNVILRSVVWTRGFSQSGRQTGCAKTPSVSRSFKGMKRTSVFVKAHKKK